MTGASRAAHYSCTHTKMTVRVDFFVLRLKEKPLQVRKATHNEKTGYIIEGPYFLSLNSFLFFQGTHMQRQISPTHMLLIFPSIYKCTFC